MSNITHITSLTELNTILDKGGLTVVDFHAEWCGPCHAIAPKFAELAKEFGHVHFLKVDVDSVQEVATEYQISAMPTFLFFQGHNKIEQIRGANQPGLESAVRKYAPPTTGSGGNFPGTGNVLGA